MNWTSTWCSRKEDAMNDVEWQARVDTAALYRLIALEGWDDLVGTHVSSRIPGDEHRFLLNPYGMLFEEITASSLLTIDLDGNQLTTSNYKFNRAGFTIHSAVHMNRDDAMFVIHLHTDYGVAVSCQEDGLKPLNQTAIAVYSDLAYHDYEGVATNLAERERIVEDLGAKNVMILRNPAQWPAALMPVVHGKPSSGSNGPAGTRFWRKRVALPPVRCRLILLIPVQAPPRLKHSLHAVNSSGQHYFEN